MATTANKEYKTQKDLEELYAWSIFYRDSNQPLAWKKCQQQIEVLQTKLRK